MEDELLRRYSLKDYTLFCQNRLARLLASAIFLDKHHSVTSHIVNARNNVRNIVRIIGGIIVGGMCVESNLKM